MKHSTLTDCLIEAARFQNKAQRLLRTARKIQVNGAPALVLEGGAKKTAVERASLDLSRALADLRAGR